MTIIQQMWYKLDEYIEQALAWEGPSKGDPKPEDLNQWCSWLEDKVDYTAKTSQGRGIAMAIEIACQPFFENSDQVMKIAMARYKAKKAGEPMPETPGFMGQVSGDALHVAAKGTAVKSGETATPAPVAIPTTKPTAGPVQNTDSPALDVGMVTAIKGAASAGFGIKQLAATFNVTEAQVESALG